MTIELLGFEAFSKFFNKDSGKRQKGPLKASIKLQGIVSQATAINCNALGHSLRTINFHMPQKSFFCALVIFSKPSCLQEVIQLPQGRE
jgi:hypothetical protein